MCDPVRVPVRTVLRAVRTYAVRGSYIYTYRRVDFVSLCVGEYYRPAGAKISVSESCVSRAGRALLLFLFDHSPPQRGMRQWIYLFLLRMQLCRYNFLRTFLR